MFESEERQITERIKDFIKKSKKHPEYVYIMLRNGNTLRLDDYRDMVSVGKIFPMVAYIYIWAVWTSFKVNFHYSFLHNYINFLDAFLSKQGFHYLSFVAPATGLKYMTSSVYYKEYLSIEVVNLDIAANNTNLPKIVVKVVGNKLVSKEKELTDEEYERIRDMFKFQKLFAGHNFEEAWSIIHEYYDEGNQSLAKEVVRIAIDYYRIFQPYTVCYDMKKWKEIVCSSIKL